MSVIEVLMFCIKIERNEVRRETKKKEKKREKTGIQDSGEIQHISNVEIEQSESEKEIIIKAKKSNKRGLQLCMFHMSVNISLTVVGVQRFKVAEGLK